MSTGSLDDQGGGSIAEALEPDFAAPCDLPKIGTLVMPANLNYAFGNPPGQASASPRKRIPS
jgi:hypothetical protein